MSGAAVERPRSLVASFINGEDGLESWVIRRTEPETGYAVLLVDTDSGETCSAVLMYPTLRDAVEKAAALSGIFPPVPGRLVGVTL